MGETGAALATPAPSPIAANASPPAIADVAAKLFRFALLIVHSPIAASLHVEIGPGITPTNPKLITIVVPDAIPIKAAGWVAALRLTGVTAVVGELVDH
jgi:hypothetical protein